APERRRPRPGGDLLRRRPGRRAADRGLIRLLLIGAVALALAGDALACTCAPVDLARDLPRADGAFIGTLLERDDRAATSTLLFRVEQVYKGDISNRVEVETASGGAACGIEAPVGERIGLLLEREGGVWTSTLCSQVDPAAFLELTDVQDNQLPPVNWGGYLVGFLVLAITALLLVRRRRRYSRLR
ncbi:MAG TPA: hypothetical protein VFV62_07260, partial [Gaiellaceae bacterium]|nr:hypothetical protein [Gaiellaceae bacterium]